METKKVLVPTIIAVVTMIVLTFSATYAYFSVKTGVDSSNTNINMTTPAVGSVAIKSGSNLAMDLSVTDMMDKGADTIYYASKSGKTTIDTTETIGTVSVTGKGTYKCNYTLKITDNDDSVYDAFQSMSEKSEGQIVLTVNGVDYDFNTANLFPKGISGTISNLTETSPQYLTAKLKLVNKTGVNQNGLSNQNITLTFQFTEIVCNAVA